MQLLVAAAQSAPTSTNLQLWSVVAVRDAERRGVLSKVAGNQKHVAKCPLFLVWLADHHRLASIAGQRGIEPEALEYVEMTVMAIVDAALAAQNAVVAAESLGLGTVYIGGMRNDPQRVAETLGLPPRTVALFGLCVGWPADGAVAEVKPRLAQSVVLHHETYDDARTRTADIEAYDRTMRRFYDQHGIGNAEGWTAHSAGRVATARGLHGRDVLGSILKARGFAQR